MLRLPQSTRDQDVVSSTTQKQCQHAPRGVAASDEDSEEDLLDQVPPSPSGDCAEDQEVCYAGLVTVLVY